MTNLLSLSQNDLLVGLNILSQNDFPVGLCDAKNLSNLAFNCYLGLAKQLQAIVPPPSMQSSIQKTKEMTKGINQLFVIIFCIPDMKL